MDDFTGSFCKIDNFPIVNSVREELENSFNPNVKKMSIKFESTSMTSYATNYTESTTASSQQQSSKQSTKGKISFSLLLKAKPKMVRMIRLTACNGPDKNCLTRNEASELKSAWLNIYSIFSIILYILF